MNIAEPAALEERVKKIEKEIKFYWRLLDIFLLIGAIVLLIRQIMPFVIGIMDCVNYLN